MTAVFTPIAALLFAVGMLIMGNGLQQTLLPVRASFEDFSAVEIGVIGSSYYLGWVIGCLYGGMGIRRVGHIRTFTALASIASTVVLVHGLLVGPLSWTLLRAISGFCFAGLFLVIESWLNDRADNHNRGLVMGIYTMIILVVIVAGQMMLTLGDPMRFPLFAVASILVSLAVVPVALSASPQPTPVTEAHLRPAKLYQASPVGFVGVFLAGVTTGAFWSLGPAYAVALGADTAQTAIFMSIAVLGGALALWPVGRLSDRMDRRAVAVMICVVGAVAAVLLVAVDPEQRAAVAALAFLFGAAALPLYAICTAHAFDVVDRADFVETSSGLLLANGAGAVAGPLVASVFMRLSGPEGLFMATAGAHVLLAGFIAWRMTTRAPVPEELRSEFDLAGSAPTMVAPVADETAGAPESPGAPVR